MKVDLISLSVGGPDYRDAPFVAKVRELAAAGITIISGGGNSGPGHGTLMNPNPNPNANPNPNPNPNPNQAR